MKKVAVFGNAGGGKSRLGKQLAALTGLPLTHLDLMKYQPGGKEVPHEEFKAAHDAALQQNEWIMEGFGSLDTVWSRLEAADTLIYIDLPLVRHYWWVTKRFLQGLFVPPDSWPKNSPLVKGTLNAYYTVGLCHQKLTPKYREYVKQAPPTKQVFHLRSRQEVKHFLQTLKKVN